MNFGQRALQVLKTFAPTLALALGGPVAPFAAAAIHAVFGTSDDKSAEAAILGATPQQLGDIQKADQDFQSRMKELGITEEKMVYDDVANARSREILVKDKLPAILAISTTIGFFCVLMIMLFRGVPPSGSDAFLVMLGSLGTAWAGVMGYYFGSSMGSATKTDALNRIATTATSAVTPSK